MKILPFIAATALTVCAASPSCSLPAKEEPVMSSCWRMRNNRADVAGIGPGINWKILGTCWVNLDSSRQVLNIEVMKPTMTLNRDAPERGGMAMTKPYQNPTGVWMLGVWESPSRRAAIFATQTWAN
jgi:hypothetical protein